MAKITRLSCPGCGASLEKPEGKDIFFCTFCGNRILVEEQNKHKIEVKQELLTRKDVPSIDCELCGGTIFSQTEYKYRCRKCGKIVCKNCYDHDSNICKDCWITCEYNSIIKRMIVAITIMFILSFPLILGIWNLTASYRSRWIDEETATPIVVIASIFAGFILLIWIPKLLVRLYRFKKKYLRF